MFHIDNIDFSENTADGRSTIHALNCVAFQPKQPNIENKIILDLPKHPKNKCLKTNSFGILKDCTKPSVKDFHHNKGFDIASTQSIPLSNFRTWVFAKAMEFLCSGYGKASTISTLKCMKSEICFVSYCCCNAWFRMSLFTWVIKTFKPGDVIMSILSINYRSYKILFGK